MIVMPLTPHQKQLQESGLTILRTVGNEVSVIANQPKSTMATNVPDKSASALDRYIKTKRHEVYGSLAMKARNPAGRSPADIDLVVHNPRQTAKDMARIVRGKGTKAKVISNPEWDSHAVQVKKNGKFIDAIDVHPFKGHYPDKYDVYGKPIKGTNIGGITTQPAADQLMRKANSIMAVTKGVFGAPPKRAMKDTVDFITTARVLLDSKELQARAELKRVKKGRNALKTWKKHARTLTGYNPNKTRVGKDPISETKEKQFIRFAVNNPTANIEKIRINRKGVAVPKPQNKTMRDSYLPKLSRHNKTMNYSVMDKIENRRRLKSVL